MQEGFHSVASGSVCGVGPCRPSVAGHILSSAQPGDFAVVSRHMFGVQPDEDRLGYYTRRAHFMTNPSTCMTLCVFLWWSGPIPQALGRLTALKRLLLGQNQFSGEWPSFSYSLPGFIFVRRLSTLQCLTIAFDHVVFRPILLGTNL